MGDGRSIHLWSDHWHPDGRLIDKYGFRIVYDTRSNREALLSSVLKDKCWCWPHARSNNLVLIQSKLHLVDIGKKTSLFGLFRVKVHTIMLTLGKPSESNCLRCLGRKLSGLGLLCRSKFLCIGLL